MTIDEYYMNNTSKRAGFFSFIHYTVAIIFLITVAIIPLVSGAPSVDLGSAGNYVSLTKTGVSGISGISASDITGDIGVIPFTGTAISGLTYPEETGAIQTKTVLVAVNVLLAEVPETTFMVTPVITNVVYVYSPPVADFTFAPANGTVPLVVTFTDASQSEVPITSWVWDFGDGTTSTLQNPPLHTYSSAGMNTVILTVADSYGARHTKTVLGAVNVLQRAILVTKSTVNPAVTNVVYVYSPPVADFTFIPVSGTVPLVVTFTDASQSEVPITSWVWDFGDGTTSTLQNPPLHTYSLPGLYSVTLTVTDSYGAIHTKTVLGAENVLQAAVPETTSMISPTVTKVVYVYFPPVADFTFAPENGTAPLLVAFTDTSQSAVPITNWTWDFGDRTTSTLQNPPLHTYSTAGTYSIMLNVTDAKGNKSMFAGCITVKATLPSGWRVPTQTPGISTNPAALIIMPCRRTAGLVMIILIISILLLAYIWRKKRS